MSETQVDEQDKLVTDLRANIDSTQRRIDKMRLDNVTTVDRIQECDQSISSIDVLSLRSKSMMLRRLESTTVELRHTYERAQDVLTRQRKSLETLADVPCGDSFPTCKFIHEAYDNKSRVSDQEIVVNSAKLAYDTALESLQVFKNDHIDEQLETYEKALAERTTLNDKKLKVDLEIMKLESSLSSKQIELSSAELRLTQLEKMLKNRDNETVVALKTNISKLLRALELLEANKMEAATTIGKLHERAEKLKAQAHEYEQRSRKHKLYELVSNAFSKRGIPTTVVNSQLPLINAEIAKILQGIVDFTIELEVDAENNDLDIFINYGDSKRIIELGSGMEKMVSSIAIRVALTNVSALPKCDTLIIDEGFGALDDGGVEAVNKLLVSLKDHYRSVIVITHVEGVKDIADHIIEISKQEKDSHVVFT